MPSFVFENSFLQSSARCRDSGTAPVRSKTEREKKIEFTYLPATGLSINLILVRIKTNEQTFEEMKLGTQKDRSCATSVAAKRGGRGWLSHEGSPATNKRQAGIRDPGTGLSITNVTPPSKPTRALGSENTDGPVRSRRLLNCWKRPKSVLRPFKVQYHRFRQLGCTRIDTQIGVIKHLGEVRTRLF